MEDNWTVGENEEKIRAALAKGADIYVNDVDFEEAEYQLAAMYRKLWKILSEADSTNFAEIETSLEY